MMLIKYKSRTNYLNIFIEYIFNFKQFQSKVILCFGSFLKHEIKPPLTAWCTMNDTLFRLNVISYGKLYCPCCFAHSFTTYMSTYLCTFLVGFLQSHFIHISQMMSFCLSLDTQTHTLPGVRTYLQTLF